MAVCLNRVMGNLIAGISVFSAQLSGRKCRTIKDQFDDFEISQHSVTFPPLLFISQLSVNYYMISQCYYILFAFSMQLLIDYAKCVPTWDTFPVSGFVLFFC